MKRIHPTPRVDSPMIYQIRVLGWLDESWSDWLGGMAITFARESDGSVITTLTGEIVDQAALHGVLNLIRDLNIPLLSVQLLNSETEFGISSRQTTQ